MLGYSSLGFRFFSLTLYGFFLFSSLLQFVRFKNFMIFLLFLSLFLGKSFFFVAVYIIFRRSTTKTDKPTKNEGKRSVGWGEIVKKTVYIKQNEASSPYGKGNYRRRTRKWGKIKHTWGNKGKSFWRVLCAKETKAYILGFTI